MMTHTSPTAKNGSPLTGYDLILKNCLDISAQTRTWGLHVVDEALRTMPETMAPTQAFALAAITSDKSTDRYYGYMLVAQMATSAPQSIPPLVNVLFTQLLAKDDDNRLQSLGLMTAFAGIADSGYALDQAQPNLRPRLEYIAAHSGNFEISTLAKAVSLRITPNAPKKICDLTVGEIADMISQTQVSAQRASRGQLNPA